MSTSGITPSNPTTSYSQLQSFSEKFKNAEMLESNESGFTPSTFVSIQEEILENLFLLQDILPGTIVKFPTTHDDIAIYGTQNRDGSYVLSVYNINERRYYDFPCLRTIWHPIYALKERLNYFITRTREKPPAHVGPFDQIMYVQYLAVLLQNILEIKTLRPGCSQDFESVDDLQNPIVLRVVLTRNMEYKILYAKNVKDDFIRIDSLEKEIYKDVNGFMLDTQALQFLQKIEAASKYYLENNVPDEAKDFISSNMLLSAYKYVERDREIIRGLADGASFRVDRSESLLARTMNVIRRPDGEYMLMYETKSKHINGEKSDRGLIFRTTNSVIKVTWRVDCTPIIDWTNKVKKGFQAICCLSQSYNSQRLVADRIVSASDKSGVNVSFLGQYTNRNSNPKQSHYYERAEKDLDQMLKANELTLEEKHQVVRGILIEVQKTHRDGKVYQDLKTKNVFVNKKGNDIFIRMADFESLFDPKVVSTVVALASFEYASPEILLSQEDSRQVQHEYYFDGWGAGSLGMTIHLENHHRNPQSEQAELYRKPDKANDMWALGILLCYVYFTSVNWHSHVVRTKIAEHPLISKLLEPNREKRIQIDETLRLFDEMHAVHAPAVARLT